ncbi:cystatin [Vibrio parahaemolyticus]|uniref:cystatin domain-containing protein n=1 Tax=Vibrio parahaemolyticus TaxID=670 RepID=UPI00111DD6B8|nr:cystatin domain-containing protein [Vibrio parahaemolyticus]EGQ7859163.1 cystatin [Vibrio parahaemolyticus]TOQ06797.1 cystatin [Vibrio parahaemolyticus]TOR17476.1 cystatin [Vibrio parahaemolyticus]HCE1805605.1 cystatin [Vibrio parahaemolyticus]HCG7766776.1 cystatin [Vibrio parahaemolyticus]
MSVRKYWGAATTLAILTITNNVYAVEKQVSPAMKKKMQAICSADKSQPGGWQVSQVTPEAQRSLSMVLYQMNAEDKLKNINEVRTQVVAGTHYAFEFELQDGEVWNAMVLRSARGDYMIERHAKKGELCPK